MKTFCQIASIILAGSIITFSQAETMKEIKVETSPEIIAAWEEKTRDAISIMIPLESEEGQKMLGETSRIDYEKLVENWIPQLKSHCGAASAVVVQNTMVSDEEFTQSGLFTPETAHIITQDVVYRIGFTLEELDDMIETRSGLKTTRFHAGKTEQHFGYEDWLSALKKNNTSVDNQLIINYPVQFMIDRQNKGGHFSPIAAYNEEKNLVLILEINSQRGSYWVDAEDVWESMNEIDSVSGMERGWIVIEKAEVEVEVES